MTSKHQNYHPDVMHESRLTPPCKATFPSPGRVHRNSGRVCKKIWSPALFSGSSNAYAQSIDRSRDAAISEASSSSVFCVRCLYAISTFHMPVCHRFTADYGSSLSGYLTKTQHGF